jgi:hypothetical protein
MDTKPKPFRFVLMPFDKNFDDIYQLGIKESCTQAGAYCERVDEQDYHGTILERIYNQIDKADFIVADMTGQNPNVFYEVGYAHALGKPTVLITQKAEDIPFDLKSYPHIVYQNRITDLKPELTRRIEWFIAHPAKDSVSERIPIELYYEDKNLSSGIDIMQAPSIINRLNFTIHNASVNTLESGAFSIAVITPSRYGGGNQWLKCDSDVRMPTTKLPDGNYQHLAAEFDTLFPGQHTSLDFELIGNPSTDTDIITLRVFTPAGVRDYPVTLRKGPKDQPST